MNVQPREEKALLSDKEVEEEADDKEVQRLLDDGFGGAILTPIPLPTPEKKESEEIHTGGNLDEEDDDTELEPTELYDDSLDSACMI